YGESASPQPSVVGHPSHRWLVAVGNYEPGSRTVDLVLSETEGGSFDEAGGVTESVVGTVELTFASCTELSMAFEFNDGGPQGQIPLERLTPADVCETLSSQSSR
ncbi:MAG: hypothetical protein R3212_10120, partial [Xanthomonadales bacterium]|nr:hypothetical protein [Xanthomonadales bacterium]